MSSKKDLISLQVRLYQPTSTDFNTLHFIRQNAWEVAYSQIYNQDEIKQYFNGCSSERRTWPNCTGTNTKEETFVCHLKVQCDTKYDNEGNANLNETKEENDLLGASSSSSSSSSSTIIIGYAKLLFDTSSSSSPEQKKGELLSLYVLPKYWNLGCGSMLWDHIITRCYEENVSSLDIWVLDQARSKDFYLSRGCYEEKSGDYFIGQHKEKAVCYRIEF